MSFSKRTFPTLIRAESRCLFWELRCSAVSCGKNGSIYGAVGADGTPYGFVGGFPSYISPWGPMTKSAKEPTKSSTMCTTLVTTTRGSGYYYSTYTVTANKGSLLSDGKDSYFELYLGYDGLYKLGEVRSAGAVTPRSGTQSWTQDGLLITVTNEIRPANPDELSKIQKTHFETKGN